MHEYEQDDMYRNISAKIFWDQIAIPCSIAAPLTESAEKWATAQAYKAANSGHPMARGNVDVMNYEVWARNPGLAEIMLSRMPFISQPCDKIQLNTQLMVCAGAVYHVDLQGWDNSLFANWYVQGPPMDFVMPLAGVRRTIYPGDVFVFDPSQVHGLVPVGAGNIGESAANTSRELNPGEYAFFLALDFDMTADTDAWFGISRGCAQEMTTKGFTAVNLMDSVDRQTGQWTAARVHA